MEWYFGGGMDELVVPKGQEMSDRLPSPDSWLQWGMSASESYGTPNKYFVAGTKPVREEFNFNGKSFCGEVGVEIRGGEQSSGSSVCSGSLDPLFHRTTFVRDQPDYQLDDLAEIDQTDDIFLSSLLEEELFDTENIHGSFCFSPRSRYTMTPSDDLSTDMIIDSQSISSDLHGVGSLRYPKTLAFSPPLDWEKEDVSASHYFLATWGKRFAHQ
ncbi:hypothetical protein L1049_021397 [Liquidambar formosana]|uniref:Uncharacterized protein n=1 Tax=Liquidambar formosana TaxID=63359 RepID=A0AAP0N5M5_LIQFO